MNRLENPAHPRANSHKLTPYEKGRHRSPLLTIKANRNSKKMTFYCVWTLTQAHGFRRVFISMNGKTHFFWYVLSICRIFYCKRFYKAYPVMRKFGSIDNRKKEVSTKLWYSTIGHLATRWLSPFPGVTRAWAYAHMIFTAVSKRDAVS